MSTWVDDCLIVGDSELLCAQLKAPLKASYKVQDYGQPEVFLGMEFAQDQECGTVSLSQSAYICAMAARFGLLDAPPVASPQDSDVQLEPHQEGEAAVDGTEYRAIVGLLLYCSTCSRGPNSACDVRLPLELTSGLGRD